METKYAGNLEDYARQIIELSGLNSEDRFSSLKEVIYHLILAAGLHDMLSSREKEVLFPFVKHVQFYFETKISLKERRKNEKKDKFPPHPLLKKDKEKKQEEKTPTPVGDERAEDFNRRKEAFRNECLLLTKVYDTQQVTDFYLYWAEETLAGEKMRWETQKTWNTKMRMKRWVNNEIANAKAVSKMRAKKLKHQQEKEKLQQQMQTEIANERAQANSQLEAEIERSKKEAIAMQEYISKNPNGILAAFQKQMQAKKEKSEK